MRLRATLADIAAILSTTMGSPGCGGQSAPVRVTGHDAGADTAIGDMVTPKTSRGDTGGDAVAADSEQPADGAGEVGNAIGVQLGVGVEAGETSSTCGPDAGLSGLVSPERACALIGQDMPFGSAGPATNWVFGAACASFCDGVCPGVATYPLYWRCIVAQSYFDAHGMAQTDAVASSVATDAGSDGWVGCPPWSDQVLIQCQAPPIGRRTESATTAAAGAVAGVATIATELAQRAYLESVSVHAFATLERELEAHGAPRSLLRIVRRARRDEVRHAAMMARLARRFGAQPRPFEAPAPPPVRTLAAIALENAVEGCVRETYGAVVGLLEARMSSDFRVRRAMRSISEDECRHAELAWAVAEWIGPRLAEQERERVKRGASDAIVALSREGDARIVRQLASRVWMDSLETAT